MAKLKKDPITADDLKEFVESDSDFGFEMRVLKTLRSEGFECSHSGTYRDPLTDKIRQYDIRAQKDRGPFTLALAVECKNLRSNCPLLISASPRTQQEAFHQILLFHPDPMLIRYPEVYSPPKSSVYRPGEIVGRKTDQVGREESGKQLVSDDAATFEKMQQAVSSCQEFVRLFAAKVATPLSRF